MGEEKAGQEWEEGSFFRLFQQPLSAPPTWKDQSHPGFELIVLTGYNMDMGVNDL
jgi:hypothetical protein